MGQIYEKTMESDQIEWVDYIIDACRLSTLTAASI